MSKHTQTNNIRRIIDANINRAKEGLRVSEEITRFILNDRQLTSAFKKIRHRIDAILKRLPGGIILLRERQSLKDVGRHLYVKELERKNYQDIFFANIQRVKESIRVLEEFSKLINKKAAIQFKKIRYSIYEIEKKTAKKFSPLRHLR